MLLNNLLICRKSKKDGNLIYEIIDLFIFFIKYLKLKLE
jgi:hypothetical protein